MVYWVRKRDDVERSANPTNRFMKFDSLAQTLERFDKNHVSLDDITSWRCGEAAFISWLNTYKHIWELWTPHPEYLKVDEDL